MLSDPIVALATAPGPSALALIRLSGRGAFRLAAAVIPSFRSDPPRTARLARFTDRDDRQLDRGLYSVFPAPASYTGEDMVEFSCHGSTVVVARLLAALEAAGARPALAGEFTRRAVLNGKLDLLQAEAVGDLIRAEAPAQARLALDQLEGGLSRRIGALRTSLLELLALLAYDVDFPGEDDGPISRERMETSRRDVASRIERLLATAPLAERVRRGALVVLVGPPNAGKSSLFNALLGTERALVTEIAGTTRDAVEAAIDLSGWPVRLVDTAGLGESTDRLEQMGQAMSRRYLDAADLVVDCDDDARSPRRQVAPDPVADSTVAGPPRLRVRTKADLDPRTDAADAIAVSVVTGEGLERLRQAIVERLFSGEVALADLGPALTRERHHTALRAAHVALAEMAPHLGTGGDAVLASHHAQEAVRALDSLVGAVDVEEVLGRVFASFCVGK